MDGHFSSVIEYQHYHFQDVGRMVGTENQVPARRVIIAKIERHQRVGHGMFDIRVVDSVFACGGVDLHTSNRNTNASSTQPQ